MSSALLKEWSDEKWLAEAVEKCSGINDLATINGMQLSHLMVACLNGNPCYVQDLLEAPGIMIGLQSNEGRHALLCASALGHSIVVQLILVACTNPQQLVNLPKTDGILHQCWLVIMVTQKLSHFYSNVVLT